MADDAEVSIFRKIWSLGNPHKLAVEHQIVSEHLVTEAVVRANQKVLDLAAGSGNTTIAAARRRARITASDVVPELLEHTRRRLEVEQLDGVEFHVADSAKAIAFADGTFDVVLSSLGASFFPSHQRIIDELLRVTRPGGTIGLALWAEASLPSDVFRAGQQLDPNATEIDKIQPAYQLGNGDYLKEMLRGAGTARIVPGNYESCHPSLDELVDLQFKYHPPGIMRMAAYPPEMVERYKEMVRQLSQRYNRATDGTVAVSMDYLIIIITKH